jgi:hypothetical protein
MVIPVPRRLCLQLTGVPEPVVFLRYKKCVLRLYNTIDSVVNECKFPPSATDLSGLLMSECGVLSEEQQD